LSWLPQFDGTLRNPLLLDSLQDIVIARVSSQTCVGKKTGKHQSANRGIGTHKNHRWN
jgi:hypothetical protein